MGEKTPIALKRWTNGPQPEESSMAATTGIDEMSIRELKQFIDCRGLEWDDCREKSDLQARAREAQAWETTQAWLSDLQENARGESTYSNAQTGHRICLTPPGYLSPPTNLCTCTASELTVPIPPAAFADLSREGNSKARIGY